MPSRRKYQNKHHHRNELQHHAVNLTGLPGNLRCNGDTTGAQVSDAQADVSRASVYVGNRNAELLANVNGASDIHRSRHLSNNVKIANLKQLNDTLVKEIWSSRTAVNELEEKVKMLEEKVQESVERANALAVEKNCAEEEKHKFELDKQSSQEEIANLRRYNADLVEEKETLLSQQQCLQVAIAESKARHLDVVERLEETSSALISAEETASTRNTEAARLRDEELRLLAVIESLRGANIVAQNTLNELHERKKVLEQKLTQLKASLANAEIQIDKSSKVIDSLRTELSINLGEQEALELQLKEAWRQIEVLEAQKEVRIARENELLSQLKSLEGELARAQMEHEIANVAMNQEKGHKGLLISELETVNSKSFELQSSLDSLRNSMSKLENDFIKDEECIHSLGLEISALSIEKARLEKDKVALNEEVKALSAGSEKASSEAKAEIEKMRSIMISLENALAEARVHASLHNRNVTQLEIDVRDLSLLVQKKEKLTRLSLPFAIASSSSLIALVVTAFFRRTRQSGK
ncbi:hypothetical protein KP509_01G062500 [Ceratopteris richardii]|uniref:Uncharacterized protein n=1 Tax=Ceratopteris richardii TaxID=49495 RepID=A0A8T2VDK0_CERRI|nr:hypothetical protein KP509_01G062500 [Ceratopteris richardii]